MAVASDFLSAFSQIPKGQQAKVLTFVNKFRTNPTSQGINYEKIKEAKDQNLYSVRIDQAYRGVVLKPEKGNVFVLLWVDHHDKAYQWAANKVYRIHPETGSLQVIDVEKAQIPSQVQEKKEPEKPALFRKLADPQLIALGIPELMIPKARSIRSEADLDSCADDFPQEAAEVLYMLAAGYTIDEVMEELDKKEKPKTVDPDDFVEALKNPDSQRRFFVAEDDLELAAILSAPLEKWRVFLHPSQRKIVERDWNGPVRVLGGAGTGKTVAALHRAKWLAQNRCKEDHERVLFTTFTRNLAADIKENLSKICPEDAMKRIDVMNLDRWVYDFLKRNGYKYEIDYGQRTVPLWKKAMTGAPESSGYDEAFYRNEWEKIIQQKEVTSLEEYLKTSRIGCGTKVSRKERKAIWSVFEEYRLLLNQQGLREPEDAMRDARILLEQKGMPLSYKSIVVDEAQDMSAQAYRLLRQMIPGSSQMNDLFIVGDAHQRIYRHKVVLGQCGINIKGRSRKLKINYRTTEETRRWAINLLEGYPIDDLDGGVDTQKGYKSLLHGKIPVVKTFQTFSKEMDFIAEYLKQGEKEGAGISDVCLVTRTNDQLKQYQSALAEKGFKTYLIKRNQPEDRGKEGVRLATMHRVKGLEFDRVIIAAVNEGFMPLKDPDMSSSDEVVRVETATRERALLYVAATRAKKEVVITSFGKPSAFLKAK